MPNAPSFWQQRRVRAWLLYPASLIYDALVSWRLSRIEAMRLPVPVICVGNNTVGGSGKTPVVIALAKHLQSLGYQPAVISRGYGGTMQGAARVDPQHHRAAQVGDEPLLIAATTPCYVAKRRIAAAELALADGADVIIMDDGLQNPSIKKDWAIMVVDGQTAFGNRFVLPAGPCREPLRRSLMKTNLSLVMGEPTHPDVQRLLNLDSEMVRAELVTKDPPAIVPGTPLIAFAAIGRPDKFFCHLEAEGLNLLEKHSYGDHHLFTTEEEAFLLSRAKAAEAKLITTEKDAMRLSDALRPYVLVWPVALQVNHPLGVAALLPESLRIGAGKKAAL